MKPNLSIIFVTIQECWPWWPLPIRSRMMPRQSLRNLRQAGLEVHMVTGDNPKTAARIAKAAGIEHFRAGVTPVGKLEYVKELQAKGLKVGMTGDGINDAPALAQADVGIAMGTGTDIAMETAEITLVSGDLGKILQAIQLSRKTMRTIRQNLFWAFFYNVIGIPVAAGILFPFLGILLNPDAGRRGDGVQLRFGCFEQPAAEEDFDLIISTQMTRILRILIARGFSRM